MLKKKLSLIILIICLFSSLLFVKSFSAYFSQDDFFHLRASQANSLPDFGKFFSFSPIRGYAFYRPLSREVYNNLMWRFFGLNPFPFHLIQFIIFTLNLFLLNNFLSKLLPNDSQTRILTIFFYATSAVHLGTFYYLGSFQILLSITFILLTLIFFLKKRYLFSFIFFFFSLLCHELSYLTPVLLFLVSVKDNGKKSAKFIAPFLVLAILFFLPNITLIKFPSQKAYLPSFSLKGITNNLAWYLLWGVGIPEHMVDFVGPGLRLNQKIVAQYPAHFTLMAVFFVLFILGLVVTVARLIVNNMFWGRAKELFFPIAWFLTTISIFLLLPVHRFVYYLILPQIGISLALAVVVSKKSGKFSYLLIIFYLLLNINAIKWGEKTYWALGRSRLAQKLTAQIKTAYPALPQGATLLFKNDPSYFSPSPDWGGTAKQAYLALSGADGIQILYKDFSLKVYYEGGSSPSKADHIFEFEVKTF